MVKWVNKNTVKELVFQLLLILTLLWIYLFNWHNFNNLTARLIFFLNYTLIALFIGYYLLPKFYYTRKYFIFICCLVALMFFSYLLEELVMEPIFWANTSKSQHVSSFISTIAQYLPLILSMTGFKLAWDIQLREKKLIELQKLVQESELKYLNSQINPHFLFNNLNNIYVYSTENSPKTPELILELSNILRYMLYDCKESLVSLNKEIKHLESYISINKLQIENRSDVYFKINGNINSYLISPLLLMMFVENAFKHSMASLNDRILIEITINCSPNGHLKFICINKYGEKSNNQNLTQGIGLQNVQKRLKLLYPDQHKLSISKENGIYKVELDLQLEKT